MRDPRTARETPAAVFLVADNLDAVLAAGEDLFGVTGNLSGDTTITTLANSIRVLEMTIAARCMQARGRASDLRQVDQRYKALIDLFIAGTRPLVDAISDLGDSTSADFQAGGCPIAYLRTRQVIASDAAGASAAQVAVRDHFLVAERIELGSLLDLCSTFLDRIEDHYELYSEMRNESAGGDINSTSALINQTKTAA